MAHNVTNMFQNVPKCGIYSPGEVPGVLAERVRIGMSEDVEDTSVWSVDANGGETTPSPAQGVYRSPSPQDTFSHMNSTETQQWCESCNEFVNDRNHILPITIKNKMGVRKTSVVRCQAVRSVRKHWEEDEERDVQRTDTTRSISPNNKMMPTSEFLAQSTTSPSPPSCATVGPIQLGRYGWVGEVKVKESSPSSSLTLSEKKILHKLEFEALGGMTPRLVKCLECPSRPGCGSAGTVNPEKLMKHLRRFHKDVNPDKLYCTCGVAVRIEDLARILGTGDTQTFHQNCEGLLLPTKPLHATILAQPANAQPANAPEAMEVLVMVKCPECPSRVNPENLKKHLRKFHPKTNKISPTAQWRYPSPESNNMLYCPHCPGQTMRNPDWRASWTATGMGRHLEDRHPALRHLALPCSRPYCGASLYPAQLEGHVCNEPAQAQGPNLQRAELAQPEAAGNLEDWKGRKRKLDCSEMGEAVDAEDQLVDGKLSQRPHLLFGKLYCALCQLTLMNEKQFRQHEEGKRHKTKLSVSFKARKKRKENTTIPTTSTPAEVGQNSETSCVVKENKKNCRNEGKEILWCGGPQGCGQKFGGRKAERNLRKHQNEGKCPRPGLSDILANTLDRSQADTGARKVGVKEDGFAYLDEHEYTNMEVKKELDTEEKCLMYDKTIAVEMETKEALQNTFKVEPQSNEYFEGGEYEEELVEHIKEEKHFNIVAEAELTKNWLESNAKERQDDNSLSIAGETSDTRPGEGESALEKTVNPIDTSDECIKKDIQEDCMKNETNEEPTEEKEICDRPLLEKEVKEEIKSDRMVFFFKYSGKRYQVNVSRSGSVRRVRGLVARKVGRRPEELELVLGDRPALGDGERVEGLGLAGRTLRVRGIEPSSKMPGPS